MYFVYIIYSKTKNIFYTGLTKNVDVRINQHSVQKRINDFELIHCEVCCTRLEARKIEKYFKSGYGREIRNEILKIRWL